MDWKAQLTSSIEAAVQAAVERSLQPAIEDILRVYTDASKQRLHRQITEIRDALSAGVHKRGGFDPEPAVATSMKPQATVVLSNDLYMGASHDADLAATTPATCSTQFPSRAVTSFVPALAPADFSSILPTRDEESVDERTRRLRRRIQLAEDRARRDPVWAEKMERRHAAFRSATTAPAMATSNSSDLTLANTCSSVCPGDDSSTMATSMMASVVISESDVTTACRACDSCVYPMAQPVAMPTSVLMDTVDCAPTRAASTADITLGSRAPTLETTKSASSSVLESNLIMVQPMAISAGTPDPVLDVPMDVLTHATLDSEDSSNSAAVTHEDELRACLSVERPLMLVATKDLADDRSFVTGTSAMPLTLAALGVDDDRVANTYKVLLPLKLLLPFSKCKELNVLTLLPQFTEAMVTWVIYLNHFGGMFSDLGSATTCSLLPWDPGEKTGLSRESFLSNDSAQGKSVKQMNADFKSSYDRHQQLGELLWYLFDSVGPLLISSATQQEFMDRYSVTAVISRLMILVMMRNEVVLYPFFQSALANTFILLPWDPGLPLSVMGTKVSIFIHELDVWLANASEVTCFQGSSIHKQRSYNVVLETILNWMVALVELQPWLSCEKYLLVSAVVRATVGNCHSIVVPPGIVGEGPIRLQYLGELYDKQYSSSKVLQFVNATHYDSECFAWEIAWFLVETSCACSECEGSGQVTSKRKLFGRAQKLICIPLFQSPVCCTTLQSRRDTLQFSPVGIHFSCIPTAKALGVLVVWTQFTQFEMTHLYYKGMNTAKYSMPTGYQVMLNRYNPFSAWNTFLLGLLHRTLLQDWLHPNFVGHNIQCPFELIHWPSFQLHMSVLAQRKYSCEFPFCTSWMDLVVLKIDWFGFEPVLEELQLSWKPGGRTFLGFFTQDDAKARRNSAAPDYYHGHYLDHAYYFDKVCANQDCYIDVFRDQVHVIQDCCLCVFLEQVLIVYYLNSMKVCLNYSTWRDLGEVMKRQVSWDPGVLARNRLEVKPKFKEGGMLATLVPGRWAATVGPGLLGRWTRRKQIYTSKRHLREDSAWNWTASASSASVVAKTAEKAEPTPVVMSMDTTPPPEQRAEATPSMAAPPDAPPGPSFLYATAAPPAVPVPYVWGSWPGYDPHGNLGGAGAGHAPTLGFPPCAWYYPVVADPRGSPATSYTQQFHEAASGGGSQGTGGGTAEEDTDDDPCSLTLGLDVTSSESGSSRVAAGGRERAAEARRRRKELTKLKQTQLGGRPGDE